MNITEEMVERLNKEVAERGCPFRFEYRSDKKVPIPGFNVVLPNMNCLNSYTLNLSGDFINWLSLWFKNNYDIVLHCNNTGSTFWAKNYNEPPKTHVKFKVPVSGGHLVAEQNTDPNNPGLSITFETSDMDIVDVVYVECPESNPRSIDIAIYDDAFSEDYTRKTSISIDDIYSAIGTTEGGNV